MILAEVTGDIAVGLVKMAGCATAAIGVMLIGAKAVDAVGRNPVASGKIWVQSILGMALTEAISLYALFFARQ